MKRAIITAAIAALAALGVAAPSAASATTKCAVVHDHITKTDNGHGTPSQWADLSLNRATTVCKTDTGYTVKLVDNGTLWTRTGAGTPNGSGGQIAHRVPGKVHGVYLLTVTGGQLAHRHGDVTQSSTGYVKSLFSEDSKVTGGSYAWAYKTMCGEHWLDSSANNDGVGAAAGNVTGRLCRPHHHRPKPSPSPTTSPTGTTSPPQASPLPTSTTTAQATSPAQPATPGEAAPAQPVTGQPSFTG